MYYILVIAGYISCFCRKCTILTRFSAETPDFDMFFFWTVKKVPCMLLCELRQLVTSGYSHFAFINAGSHRFYCSLIENRVQIQIATFDFILFEQQHPVYKNKRHTYRSYS